jgi:signal transduction histidine kinase
MARHRGSLYARLALVLAALLAVVGAAWIATSWVTSRLYQEELEQRLNRDLARQLLSDTAILDQGVREADLEHIFHVLMVVNPRIEVYLLDRGGRILAYSAPEGKVVRERVSLGPIRAFLSGSARLPIRGDDPRQAGGHKIFSVAEIPAPAAAGDAASLAAEAGGGYLYVVLGGERYESVVAGLRSNWVLRLAAGVALGALAVALAVGLVLFRRLTRRLERLDRRIRNFHSSPDETLAEPPAGDEIDRLEAAFGRMAERIEEQIRELSALDELRRDLVANVSHDLRTPIAALQGYLETLQLKESTLPDEERRRYVEIAARHAEHLGKLVAQLFELARLDVEEARLEVEPVSLAELAQDVVQKFHLAAERHGVTLESVPERPPAAQPFVAADIRLLERALDNLLDNALAHTPPGGRVTLEVAETAGGLRLRLADTGTGIPPEELPRVFDRFHRAGDRGRRAQPGAGLGLAIAKRILELHGSDLAVESTVGRGTAFSFELPFTSH